MTHTSKSANLVAAAEIILGLLCFICALGALNFEPFNIKINFYGESVSAYVSLFLCLLFAGLILLLRRKVRPGLEDN